MNDLRDRIAAAIYNELRAQADRDTAFPVMVSPAVGSPNFNGVALIDGEVDLDAAADAVIRELGLRQQWLVDGYKPFDVKPPEWNQVARTRYVTDWKADDEVQ